MRVPRIGSLCTGYGGLDLAAQAVFDGELAWWSDIEPGPIKVMRHHHPGVPNIGDLKAVDWYGQSKPRIVTVEYAHPELQFCGDCDWADHDPYTCDRASERGEVPSRLPRPDALIAVQHVNEEDRRRGRKQPKKPFTYTVFPPTPIDILTTGYPCQPFSNAGKRLGTEDPRHLWPWIAYAIGVLRPRIILLENVEGHLRRGFDVVSADLAAMGYRVAWGIVSAAEVGAAHLRKRIYIVAADASRERDDWPRSTGSSRRDEHSGRRGTSAHPAGIRRGQGRSEPAGQFGRSDAADGGGDYIAGAEIQDWLHWEPAIRRWESILGVTAPIATVPNPRAKNGRSLSPYLTEWMMGVPGRITSVPGLTRNEQIKLAGNGVVLQQAMLAIPELLDRLAAFDDIERAA